MRCIRAGAGDLPVRSLAPTRLRVGDGIVQMKWACTKCGSSVIATPGLLVERGWWITTLGGGLCPPCARMAAFSSGKQALKQARLMNGARRGTRMPAQIIRIGAGEAAPPIPLEVTRAACSPERPLGSARPRPLLRPLSALPRLLYKDCADRARFIGRGPAREARRESAQGTRPA